ncbi:MAG: nickel-dependent hydrogenase large subunit [Verrucomicrobiota bacterium]
MSQTITMSPVTRIEGHLGIRVEVDSGHVVRAEVSGEMFRGFEVLLRGRDPLDAQYLTQRICGVCPVDHGIASVLAQDMAYQLAPPDNGRLLRNLTQAANFIASHITHFYLLSALDFVDVAMIVDYAGNDRSLLDLQAWVKSQLASRQVYPAAPFLPRYSAKYLADKDANFGALKHYLESLEVRTLAHRMGAVFAGKLPHAATLVPGGVTVPVTSLNISQYRTLLEQIQEFIDRCYLPDVIAVAQAFPEYFAIAPGCGNFLAYGGFPEAAGGAPLFLPGGACIRGEWQPVDPGAITEDVGQSRFESASGLHPFAGETVASPAKAGAYSWLKAPRYRGEPMEVGPLARVLAAARPGGNPSLQKGVDGFLKSTGRPADCLRSVMGRHAARAIECKALADRCSEWLDQLTPGAAAFKDFSIPDAARGYGLTEAARGALGHWIEIRGGRIANYQCVVPTTWNCSPRDDRGVAGPVEQSLAGLAVADAANPIEVARVVRSFDPCLACAVH